MVQPGSAMVTSAACSARAAPPSAITVTGQPARAQPGRLDRDLGHVLAAGRQRRHGGGLGRGDARRATVTVARPASDAVSLTTVTCTICRGRAALPRKRRVEVTALIRMRSWSHAGRIAGPAGAAGYDSG